MTKRCRSGHTSCKDAAQSPYNDLEDVFPRWYSRFILGRRAPVFGLSPLLHQCGSRFRFPIAKNPFVSERGHHRICSKSYSKDSGMILRLDVAVERRRRARPVWRAALCGQHTALEQVTERIRGIIPILATRTDLRVQRKRCPTSCSPTSLRSAGNTSASAAATSGRPNRSNRRFRPCESFAPRSSMPLTVRFRTDSAMTPLGLQIQSFGRHVLIQQSE
jgi:hypothetical protein